MQAPEPTFTDTVEVHWKTHEEGLTQAAADDKHVFVYIETSWCSYCRKMKQTTFRESAIAGMLNEQFVPVMINAESSDSLYWHDSVITYRDLCRDVYELKAIPTMWFLRPDGTKIDRLVGYRSGEALMPVLKYVAERGYDTSSAGPVDGSPGYYGRAAGRLTPVASNVDMVRKN